MSLSCATRSNRCSSRQRGTEPVKTKSGNVKKAAPEQISLHFIDEDVPIRQWEYAVLVTNTNCCVAQMSQIYRDRAECEKGFDELKKQWGWGGYSTQDIERFNLSTKGRTDLQLVEFVREACQSQWPTRSHYQSTAVICGCLQ